MSKHVDKRHYAIIPERGEPVYWRSSESEAKNFVGWHRKLVGPASIRIIRARSLNAAKRLFEERWR